MGFQRGKGQNVVLYFFPSFMIYFFGCLMSCYLFSVFLGFSRYTVFFASGRQIL